MIYGSGALEGDNPVSRALRADEGTFHGPFATDNGYIVLQVLRRRPDRLPPLDEIREQSRGGLGGGATSSGGQGTGRVSAPAPRQ